MKKGKLLQKLKKYNETVLTKAWNYFTTHSHIDSSPLREALNRYLDSPTVKAYKDDKEIDFFNFYDFLDAESQQKLLSYLEYCAEAQSDQQTELYKSLVNHFLKTPDAIKKDDVESKNKLERLFPADIWELIFSNFDKFQLASVSSACRFFRVVASSNLVEETAKKRTVNYIEPLYSMLSKINGSHILPLGGNRLIIAGKAFPNSWFKRELWQHIGIYEVQISPKSTAPIRQIRSSGLMLRSEFVDLVRVSNHLIASIHTDHALRIWDLETLQCYKKIELEFPNSSHSKKNVMSSSCSYFGIAFRNNILVVCNEDGQLNLYDVTKNFQLVRSIVTPKSDSPHKILISADEKIIMKECVASEQSQITIWDMHSGELLHGIKTEYCVYDNMCLLSTNRLAVYEKEEGCIAIINLATYESKKISIPLPSGCKRGFGQEIMKLQDDWVAIEIYNIVSKTQCWLIWQPETNKTAYQIPWPTDRIEQHPSILHTLDDGIIVAQFHLSITAYQFGNKILETELNKNDALEMNTLKP